MEIPQVLKAAQAPAGIRLSSHRSNRPIPVVMACRRDNLDNRHPLLASTDSSRPQHSRLEFRLVELSVLVSVQAEPWRALLRLWPVTPEGLIRPQALLDPRLPVAPRLRLPSKLRSSEAPPRQVGVRRRLNRQTLGTRRFPRRLNNPQRTLGTHNNRQQALGTRRFRRHLNHLQRRGTTVIPAVMVHLHLVRGRDSLRSRLSVRVLADTLPPEERLLPEVRSVAGTARRRLPVMARLAEILRPGDMGHPSVATVHLEAVRLEAVVTVRPVVPVVTAHLAELLLVATALPAAHLPEDMVRPVAHPEVMAHPAVHLLEATVRPVDTVRQARPPVAFHPGISAMARLRRRLLVAAQRAGRRWRPSRSRGLGS